MLHILSKFVNLLNYLTIHVVCFLKLYICSQFYVNDNIQSLLNFTVLFMFVKEFFPRKIKSKSLCIKEIHRDQR